MDLMNASIPEVRLEVTVTGEGNAAEVENFKHLVDEICTKIDELEQRLNEVEQFYSTTSKRQINTSKGTSIVKDKEKEKHIANFKKRQLDASKREAAAAKRMQELMRQFGTILRQITQHKWAGPFMLPVDVVGLGLHDYYEVIEKPMDFSTIKSKMEAKDGTGYKNVREMCADVRLIFKNAMKYNDERNDVHVMAKTLLAKFEEKWLPLLPKVDEEEKRRKEEEAEAQLDMQLAQEAAHAKMARDLSNELDEADKHLEKFREMVLQKCRKITTEEKKRIGTALTQLSPEDLNKALLIVAQNNPSFIATAEEVDLDMDAQVINWIRQLFFSYSDSDSNNVFFQVTQVVDGIVHLKQSESTLWKLKLFVKDALRVQGKSSASMGGNNPHHTNNNNKRKKEICDALAKTSLKKSKKLSS